VRPFRRLLIPALASGTLSGVIWFALQYFTVIPLIERAEQYEMAASNSYEDHGERFSRNSLTAVTTVLAAIGFASVLFGVVSLSGRRWDVKTGALWGIAAFACTGIAPAFGLPPQPPGTAVADLPSRQLWWLVTVAATAIALYWIVLSSRRPLQLCAGVVLLLLPHWIGAPRVWGTNMVPDTLVRQFEVASLAAEGVFWLALGLMAGLLARDKIAANELTTLG
jgi:cobalt transporter subunit CbtA